MKLKKVMSFLLVVTLVLSLTTGCSKKNSSYEKTDLAVTIDDEKYTMADLLFYIYSFEAQIDSYDQMYQYYFQTSYWDMEIDEETKLTVREDAKQQAMDTAIRYEILYKEAVKKGYELTDKEIESVKSSVKSSIGLLTKEQLALTGFTEENVSDVQLRWALADKYYTDIIESFNIDKDKIKAGIDKEQYKEYATKSIEIPITKTNEDGESKPLSEKEKAAAKEKIEAVYKKVKAGKALDKVLGEDETELFYNEDMSFLPNDEQETTDKKYMAAAVKLKKGEVSGIVEGDEAYYIIEMVDDNATKSFDQAVTEAITEEENSRFDEEFEKIKKNHTVEINNKVWDKVVMGNNTIVKGDKSASAEDNNAPATDDASN